MKISEETSQKIKNMSILCATFVVLIHIGLPSKLEASTWIISQIIPQGIANIAVPFFFILSGFFLAAHFDESGWWKREAWKRVKSLLVPFYLWTLIYVVATLPLSIYADYAAHRPFGSSFYFLDDPIRVLGFDFTHYVYVGPLWYIRCLLIFVLISPLFAWLVKRLGWVWLIASLVIWLLNSHISSVEKDNIFWLFGFSLSGVFFFSVGIFLRLTSRSHENKRATRDHICPVRGYFGFCENSPVCSFHFLVTCD